MGEADSGPGLVAVARENQRTASWTYSVTAREYSGPVDMR